MAPSSLVLIGNAFHSLFVRCSMAYASPVVQVLSVLFIISTTIESNGSLSVLRMRESVCERCLSVMTKRRVSALVTASVLSVGCSASAAVCRAVGRHEANARAVIRRKRSFACFIVFVYFLSLPLLSRYLVKVSHCRAFFLMFACVRSSLMNCAG